MYPLASWIIIFSEGFESGIPATWTVGNGGSSYTWVDTIYGTKSYEPPGSGNRYVICDANSGGYPFYDTLYSPIIHIDTIYDSVKVKYAFAFKKYGSSDQGKVILRYFDGTSWSSWVEAKIYSDNHVGLDSIILPTYDSIQIAFIYTSNEWSFWFSIDDFTVQGQRIYDYDVSADEIIEPSHRGIYFEGNSIYPWVVATNRGLNDVYTWAILRIYLDTSLIYADSTLYYSLKDSTDTINLRVFYLDTIGVFKAVFRVRADVDSVPENDSVIITFQGVPSPIRDTVIPYSTVEPTIDGVFTSSEWSDALSIDVSNYGGKGSTPVDSGTRRMYIKHDGSYIYVCIVHNDTTYDDMDFLDILINDDADNYWDEGEGENALYPSPSRWWATRNIYPGPIFGQWIYPRKDRGTFMSFGSDVLEFKIPFSPADLYRDPSYIRTYPDGYVLISMFYKNASDDKILIWWPQDVDTSEYYDPMLANKGRLRLERPDNWFDVGIAGVLNPPKTEYGYTCFKNSNCDISVVIYDNNSSLSRPCTLHVNILEYPSLVSVYSKDTVLSLPTLSIDTITFTWRPASSGYYRMVLTLSSDSSLNNNFYEHTFGIDEIRVSPYIENFDGEFWLPLGWNFEGIGWFLGNHFLNNNIAPPFGASGYKFAEFTSFIKLSGDSASLISPKIIVSDDPVISFYWWNGPTWSGRGNYDVLKVYYRTETLPWTLAGIFSGDVYNWKREIVPLPLSSGDTVQIKFTAVSDYGDTDISLDDVGIVRNPVSVKDVRRVYDEEFIKIYDVSGRIVYQGRGLPRLRKGVFFIKAGSKIEKLIIP